MQSTLARAVDALVPRLVALKAPLPEDAGPAEVARRSSQLRAFAEKVGDVLDAAVTDLSCHAPEIVPDDADFAAAVTELVDEAIGVPVRHLIEQAVPVHVTGLYVVGR